MKPYDGETKIAHWHKDDCDTYIGRWTVDDVPVNLLSDHPVDQMGFWGNPFEMDEDTQAAREEAVARFADAFLALLDRSDEFRERVFELQGDALGCYCRRVHEDGPVCHGDVIARAADRVVVKA